MTDDANTAFTSIRQVSFLTGMGRDSIYRAIDAGEFPGYRITGEKGVTYKVPTEGLNAFLAGTWIPVRFRITPELAGDEWQEEDHDARPREFLVHLPRTG